MMSRPPLRWWGWALVALLVIAPRASQAQAQAQSAPLTLDEVLGSVEQAHPGIEVAERKVEQADGKAFAARGGFDPLLTIRGKWAPVGYYNNGQVDAFVKQATPAWGISLYAGYRVGWGTYPVYKGDLQTLSGGEVRAGIEVPVWRGGPIDSRRAKIQQTRIQRRGAEYDRDATQLQLERQAARAYWSWVAAGLRLQVARELLVIAERRGEALQEQVDAGALERIKLVDNRRLVLDRKGKRIAAERKFQEASLDLSLFFRDGQRTPVQAGEDRVPDRFPTAVLPDMGPLEGEIDRALRERPDVAALEQERDAAQVDVRLARNQRAPEVKLQTFVARDIGIGPEELGLTEWGAGIVVEAPLPLRKARGDLRAARAQVAGVDAKRRGLRDKVGAEIRKSQVALLAAQQGIDLATEQVAAADELAEAERDRLREGASDLVVLNLRELAAADAANQVIDANADFQRARADFLTATGRSPAG